MSDQTLDSDPLLTRNSSLSKLNAQAPEFVPSPRSLMIAPPPVTVVHATPFPATVPRLHMHHHQQHHHHHHHHHHNQNHQKQHPKEVLDQGNGASRNGLSDEAAQKLINQVEYYFSDVNLATTDHLIRFINKDPEGNVPISVVASFKKIKSLIGSNGQLGSVLRNSTKIAVSEDGKKVKRLHPVSDMEELKARIIVAENLPEDHCHQNLMKVFSAVGSVKSIRTCQPHPSKNGASSAASKTSKTENMHYTNKLHAFVEYESAELAEKAIIELNDEDDWRNGLKVRLLLKHGSKLAQPQAKKAGNEGEINCEEDPSTSEQIQNENPSEDPSGLADAEFHDRGEAQSSEKEGGQKKVRNRSRAKGHGKSQNQHPRQNHTTLHHHHHQNNKGNHVGAPPMVNEHPKQQPPGPRMPDGTRGFSMGRGKPVNVNTAS